MRLDARARPAKTLSETLAFPRLVLQQFPDALFVHAPVFLAVRLHDFLLGSLDDLHVLERLGVPLARQELLLLAPELQHGL